jgi:hypothetical protein
MDPGATSTTRRRRRWTPSLRTGQLLTEEGQPEASKNLAVDEGKGRLRGLDVLTSVGVTLMVVNNLERSPKALFILLNSVSMCRH